MTLVVMAGGEVGDLSEAEATSGTVAIESGIVRSGGFSYRLTPSGALASARFVGLGADGDFADLALSTVFATFWLWLVTLPAADRTFFQFVNGSNTRMVDLKIDAAGVCTIDGSTTSASLGTVTTGVWNKFEIKGVQNSTCEGALNDGAVQTCTGLNFDCDRVILGAASGSASTHDAIYDDLLVDTAEYPGDTLSMDDIKIDVLTADGVGANDEWILFAGASKQAAVSEIPNDGDTTAITESASGDVQDFTLVDPSTIPINEPILGVKSTAIGRGFTTGDYGVGIKQTATYSRTNAAFVPGGTYSMCAKIDEVDPVSTIAFINGDLTSLQTSVEKGAVVNNTRVTQVLLHVAYSATPPIPPTLPASEPEFLLLDNTDRIAQEDAFVVIDQTAREQIRAVFVSAIDPVANVAIAIVGGDCDTDPTQLPGLRLTWDEVTPGSGISFIAYDIMRRVAGEDDFTRIAILTDITATEYTDFCTTSRVTYEYSVRWRVTAGAAQVTSPDTDPPVFAQVEFDFLFLHLEKDTSFFVRLDTYRADKRRLRDQRQLAVWGRARPTLAIGEQIWHQLRIPGLQQLLDDRVGVWGRLLDLMDQEGVQASVVCVRFGRASERYFCNFIQETQRQAQKSYTPDVTLVEVHFDEAV